MCVVKCLAQRRCLGDCDDAGVVGMPVAAGGGDARARWLVVELRVWSFCGEKQVAGGR